MRTVVGVFLASCVAWEFVLLLGPFPWWIAVWNGFNVAGLVLLFGLLQSTGAES